MDTNAESGTAPARPGIDSVRTDELTYRHLSFGWWSLLFYLSLGLLLEALHGFKVDWYLTPANETRRLMLTLGHAHGTLLALVHLGFAATLAILADAALIGLRRAGSLLIAASVLLPGGFLAGGVTTYAGDPGLGILLVPLGAFALLLGALLVALGVSRATTTRTQEKPMAANPLAATDKQSNRARRR